VEQGYCHNTFAIFYFYERSASQKGFRDESCWLHPRQSGPEVDQGGVTTAPTLLGPVLVWNQQEYLASLKTVRY